MSAHSRCWVLDNWVLPRIASYRPVHQILISKLKVKPFQSYPVGFLLFQELLGLFKWQVPALPIIVFNPVLAEAKVHSVIVNQMFEILHIPWPILVHQDRAGDILAWANLHPAQLLHKDIHVLLWVLEGCLVEEYLHDSLVRLYKQVGV